MNVILKSKHLYKPFQLQCSFLSSSDLMAMKYKLFSIFKNQCVSWDFIPSDFFSLKIDYNLIQCNRTTLSPASTPPCLRPTTFFPDPYSIPFVFFQKRLVPQETIIKHQKRSYNKKRQKSSYRGWTRKSSSRKTVSIANKRVRDTYFPTVRNLTKPPS